MYYTSFLGILVGLKIFSHIAHFLSLLMLYLYYLHSICIALHMYDLFCCQPFLENDLGMCFFVQWVGFF